MTFRDPRTLIDERRSIQTGPKCGKCESPQRNKTRMFAACGGNAFKTKKSFIHQNFVLPDAFKAPFFFFYVKTVLATWEKGNKKKVTHKHNPAWETTSRRWKTAVLFFFCWFFLSPAMENRSHFNRMRWPRWAFQICRTLSPNKNNRVCSSLCSDGFRVAAFITLPRGKIARLSFSTTFRAVAI